jgi:hypothetical protein
MGSLSLFNNIPSWSDSFGIDTSGAFGSNIPSWSDSFGIDTSGAFGSVGGSLGSNPFGGAGGLGQFAPLIAGRFGSMLMGNANTAQSAQNAMGTSIGMFDMNQGVAAADRRRAIYEDMMNPIRASRIRMNPEYRRGQVRDTLLSGPNRYSVFMA